MTVGGTFIFLGFEIDDKGTGSVSGWKSPSIDSIPAFFSSLEFHATINRPFIIIFGGSDE